jgi:ERCC4-type nuclease
MIFENIFSNKKTKEEINPIIVVDYREKNSLVFSELIKQKCIPEPRLLEIGDYIAGETVIERKTIKDFANSIINKRIFHQIKNLTTINSKLLLLEGIEDYLYKKHNLNENALKGAMISISLKNNIPIIFSKDSEDSARIIKMIALKHKNINHSLKQNKIPKSDDEKIIFLLSNFEGIGKRTAEKLINEFKTIRNIFNSSEEDIKKVIGKRAETFRILDKEYQNLT